jgi:hypothetical protein
MHLVCSSRRVESFVLWSLTVWPARGLNNFISAASILRLFEAVKVLFSDPYKNVGKTKFLQQSQCDNRQYRGCLFLCIARAAIVMVRSQIEHDEARSVLHSCRIAMAFSYFRGTELWLNFCRLCWLRFVQYLALSLVCGVLSPVCGTLSRL